MLWGSSSNTCADILGFLDEDSNVINPVVNPLTTYTIPIGDAVILAPNQVQITASNHGLAPGEQVRIVNLNTKPNTYGADGRGTLVTVLAVDTPDSFVCNLPVIFIDLTSLPVAYVGTSIITFNYVSHGFNQINSVTRDTSNSALAAVQTTLPHLLMAGDVVFLGGSNSLPSLLGRYTVQNVPSSTVFTVNPGSPITQIGTRGIIGDTGQNIIKSAVIASNGTNIITVTTAQVSGILPGQSVYITLPAALPEPLSGVFEVLSTTSSYTFQFNAGTSLIFTGSSGTGSVITFSETFILYNVTSDGTNGFPPSCINGVRFSIREVISTSLFSFSIPGNYAALPGPNGTGVAFGGNDVGISSGRHGFNGTQSNVDASNAIIRNVNLSGPDFLYLTCPNIPMDDIIDASGKVKNILAKLYLNGPVNTVLFNSCTDIPKYFTNGFISLDKIHFQILDTSGSVVSTNNMDFSLSLQINPISYEDTGNQMNSRNYLRIKDADDAMQAAIASGRV